jgi:hypothetical protein
MELSSSRNTVFFSGSLLFWLGLFLVVLQAERLCLLPEVAAREPPSAGLLLWTLLAGLRNDLVVCGSIAGIALILASIPASLLKRRHGRQASRNFHQYWQLFFAAIGAVVTVALVCLTTADVGYYTYNHQHLDFVFFEYVDDLVHGVVDGAGSQAAEQTVAEIQDAGKWVWRIGRLWMVTVLLATAWILAQRRLGMRASRQWRSLSVVAGLGLALPTVIGAGLSPSRLDEALLTPSEAYNSLSQNLVGFSFHPLRDAFLSKWMWMSAALPEPMAMMDAIREAQGVVGGGDAFPFPDYPLVRQQDHRRQPHFGRPVNILLLFIEGLDRRFLNQVRTIPGEASIPVRVTPFLDQLKNESLYFEHFFSNGVQTTRGLFSTLCSAFPRQGTAVIKTRSRHEYLCMPEVLQQAGYRTEMVVSLDADQSGLREFLEHNGVDRYYSEQDFPSEAERLGVGLTDRTLFDFLETRMHALQSAGQPFMLAALTAGTHHPFTVPADHPDVQGLLRDPDPYVAALRYCDWALEQMFSDLQSKNLLRRTLVVILGDHGRHEPIGLNDTERQVGHFLVPLIIWADDSLRTGGAYRPRAVHTVASQVDIAPTLLSLNGVMPRRHPFVGHDLTCHFSQDCSDMNRAYLSSVYDDLIGLADSSGIWLYSFRRQLMTTVDIDLKTTPVHPVLNSGEAQERAKTMAALYLASNTLLEENRLWSANLVSPP